MKPNKLLLFTLAAGIAAMGCGDDVAPTAQREARPFVISPGLPPTLASLTAGIPGTEGGQLLGWNGTAWVLDDYTADPSLRYNLVEEFERGTTGAACSSVGPFVGALSGTGATCSFANSTNAHPGVLTMETGTTATGGDRLGMQGAMIFGGGVGSSCVTMLVSFNALSTTTIEYNFRGGFAEPVSNADSVDAVELIYDRARAVALVGGGGNFWMVETSSNSTRTEIVLDGSTQGGVTTVSQPITAGTWYTVKGCVNAAGTSATFFVNGTLSATLTTNIPTGTTRSTSLGLQCFNNNGGTPANQLCFVDYFKASLPFGTAR